MTAKVEYDAVVLGSGIAGLSAALAAREVGLSSIVIEKADLLGGGTCYSYGLIWIGGNHLAEAEGLTDDPGEICDYARFLCGGEGEDGRLEAFLGHATNALRFFEGAGLRFQLVHGLTDHYFGTAKGARETGRSLEATPISGAALGPLQHKIVLPPNTPYFVSAEEQIRWGGMSRVSEWDADIVRQRKADDMRGMGVALVCRFVQALQAREVPIETGAAAEGLVTENGRVTGVRLADGRTIGARKGVVLATGGYEANPKMMDNLERVPGWRSQFPASVTGDGMVLGAEIGAAVRVVQNNMQLFLGIEVPGGGNRPASLRLAGIIELCSPHTLVVNRDGRRFADESYFQGMVEALRRFDISRHDYENLPCYLVFDQSFAGRYSFAGNPAGDAVPDWVARGQTIPELAARLGVSADGLADTVARFNGFARAGVDGDFRRGRQKWQLVRGDGTDGSNPSLGAVIEPPFYGVELHPTGAGAAGLLADEKARVRHLRGHVIDGLYAIGNTAAHTEYGTGYQAGQSLASAMTFSYLAANHMADRETAAPWPGASLLRT